MMRLHDNLSSGNGYKARLLLAQLGLPFERIEYDIDRGETRTPEFLENVNPNGRVPVLETESGELLPESNAILYYLAEGTSFLPDDRLARARGLQWMFFEQYSHEPNIATPRFWITHGVEITEERRLALETKRKLGYDALGMMEGHLEANGFFVEDRATPSQTSLCTPTPTSPARVISTSSASPAVRAWLERVAAQPDHVPITQG
jgi:glutathione S-transferase